MNSTWFCASEILVWNCFASLKH